MSDDKLKDLKNILLGDELKRFDTQFMEFGDKLTKISESSSTDDIDKIKIELNNKIKDVDEQVLKLKKDVKSGFDKIIDTINAQFSSMEDKIVKNSTDVESIRKKFDGLKTLLSS